MTAPAIAGVIALELCQHGTCHQRATETVGGVPSCTACAATIRRAADQLFRAKEEWEAQQRRATMAVVRDQIELPLVEPLAVSGGD